MSASPEKVLEKLPKTTPIWAVGIVSVIVSLAVSFVVAYPIARPELSAYLKARDDQYRQELSIKSESLASVLSLVGDNSRQITLLSEALQRVERRAEDLQRKVQTLETDLNSERQEVVRCQQELAQLKKGKGC